MALIIVFFACTKTGNETITSTDEIVQEEAAPVVEEFTGYLVDVTCGLTGKGLDGANLVTNPDDHTMHCLEACAASGFGVMLENSDGETFKFVKFDGMGNNLSNEILSNMTENTSAFVTARGYIEDNIIAVSELELNN